MKIPQKLRLAVNKNLLEEVCVCRVTDQRNSSAVERLELCTFAG